jgi:transcriptional regulator with XRE-family HTH domain
VSAKDLQRFGARVRAERERLGISQEELADRAGLHRTYLGGVERGERNLGLLNLLRIARALQVPPSALFTIVNETTRR